MPNRDVIRKCFTEYLQNRKCKTEEAKKAKELVEKTLEHFLIRRKTTGDKRYDYIVQRWIKRRSYRRVAVELGISYRASDHWVNDIMYVAEAIAIEYDLL